MAKKQLDLANLIDADQLRRSLSDLTRGLDGDGSSPATRGQALELLKKASKQGREAAKEQLFRDGDGTACARRISHVQDEIVRVMRDSGWRSVSYHLLMLGTVAVHVGER